jgi:hypothetical protein
MAEARTGKPPEGGCGWDGGRAIPRRKARPGTRPDKRRRQRKGLTPIRSVRDADGPAEGAGMRWDTDNAASVMALASPYRSGLWAPYWESQRLAA